MSGEQAGLYQVSLDPGNWAGKAVRAGREVVIRNAATPYDPSDDALLSLGLFGGGVREALSSNGEPATDSLRIGYSGKQWLVGAAAEHKMVGAGQVTGYRRYGTPEWDALFAALLTGLYSRRSGAVSLIWSVPVRQIKAEQSETLSALVAGQWQVLCEDKPLIYDVLPEYVDIVPEGFGSLTYLCLSESGKVISDRALLASRVAIFDIGGFTTDILTFNNLDLGDYNESIPYGLIHVRNEVNKALVSLYHRETPLASQDADRVIRTGRYKPAGSPEEDVSEIVRAAMANLVLRVGQIWREELRRDDIDTVILSGGGGPATAPLLKPQMGHGDVRVIPEGEAHLANARGALRYRLFMDYYMRGSHGGQ